MSRLDVPALIRRKREGSALAEGEWRALVAGYARGDVPDYQFAALAMAVFFRGMTPEETAAMTLAMRDSGEVLPRGIYGRVAVDKHSTGGVGDKVSIPLAPLVAATGVAVPMITGRGLGHTGGTADKLESIPGFRVRLEQDEFVSVVRRVGAALAAQSETLAPADKRLYALRDVTATVESIPLITASILSKKLAEGIDGLVLDVKHGRGAFMRELDDARALARSLVSVGEAAGTRVRAVLTPMEAPIGTTIGNALEIRESIDVLEGRGEARLVELVVALAVEMLELAGVTREEGRKKVLDALASGAARARLDAIVGAQGGDVKALAAVGRTLVLAERQTLVRAPRAGYVVAIDGRSLGMLAMRLGAGRLRAEDRIDPRVGVELHVGVGTEVRSGDPLATIHGAGDVADEIPAAEAAFTIAEGAARGPAVITEVIDRP